MGLAVKEVETSGPVKKRTIDRKKKEKKKEEEISRQWNEVVEIETRETRVTVLIGTIDLRITHENQ